MSTLWWIRHGPTHARGMVGWTDLPADLGDLAALERLRDALPDAPVISSPLVRAVNTADAIQGSRPRLPHDPDLREMSFGAWETRLHDEIDAEDPVLLRAFWERPGETRPPGGESWNELRTRVDRAADRLLTRGEDVIVVAHFGPILTQYQRAADLTTVAAFGQRIDNLSLSQFRRDGAGWTVCRVNYPA